ncbi:MAG: glycosyltransferase [Hyphomonadaceae bacterium]
MTSRASSGASWRTALNRFVIRTELSALQAMGAASDTDLRPGALTVSGFINETLGIGRAARLTLSAMQAAGLSPRAHDLRALWPHKPFAGGASPTGQPGGVWLLHCNAPEGIAALAKARRADWKHAYRIGYWAYELPTAPRLWRRAASLFHEIWVPSQFVANALRGCSTPVRVMPHPVEVDAGACARPPEMAAGVFHVLATGDLRSSFTRKNILGAVEIFRTAFPTPSPGLKLMLKLVTRGETSPALARVMAAIAGRPDIVLVERDMPDQDAHAFLAHSDVLLHPHRSEGFGLMIAEAFLLGTPALATGWSGNLDFMSVAPDLLIPAREVPAEDPDGVYDAPGQVWADPDVNAAAARLRGLVAAPDSARSRVEAQVEAVRGRLHAMRDLWASAAMTALPLARHLEPPSPETSPQA